MKQMFLQRRGDNSQTLLPQKWLLCLLTLLLSVFGAGQAMAGTGTYVFGYDSNATHVEGTSTFTFANNKTILITNDGNKKGGKVNDTYQGLKYSKDVTYTITFPEYEIVKDIKFEGSTRNESVTSVISKLNGADRTDYPGDDTGNPNVAFTVKGSSAPGYYHAHFWSTQQNTVSFVVSGTETNLKITVETEATGAIGNVDYTSGFATAYTDRYVINKHDAVNDHQVGNMRTFSFKNHGGLGQNYYNWVLRVMKDASSEERHFDLNLYPQVWGDGSELPLYQSFNGTLAQLTSSDWTTFRNDMLESDVTVKVAFTGSKVYVYSVMTGNGRTYVYYYSQNVSADAIYPRFTIEHSYITNFSATEQVVALPTTAYIDYVDDCPDDQKTGCSVERYTPEGMQLTDDWLVGVGDQVGFKAVPVARFETWGTTTDNPRYVTVNNSNHVSDGIVKPTATFKGMETPEFYMSPNPYYTYVGATNVGRADIVGLPGSGWEHLSSTIAEPKNDIASLNNNNWVLGGKAGKVTATINMEAHDIYTAASATSDLIVKPGRVSGSTATYSVDFTQYLNQSEIQAAFGATQATRDGYLSGLNISNDPNVTLQINAPGASDYSNNQCICMGAYTVDGRSKNTGIHLELSSGTISKVILTLGDKGNQNIRFNGTQYDATNHKIEITGLSLQSFDLMRGNGLTYLANIEIEYSAEPGFSETSVRYNIADLKKSATEVPQLIAMPNATYSSANTKIVKVNSDGSLVFLKTGRTSIKATANGVTKSYDIEIYADAAEFSVSNDGAKYTYQVTKAGMLPTNAVASIPGITMTYGSYGETPLVATHKNYVGGNGLGIAVIGSATGNEGVVAPVINNSKFEAGTYYLFTPTISGTLSISGYFEGSHSAWFREYTDAGMASTNKMTMTRDTKALVTGSVTVEGGKTYCLYCPLDDKVENYFMLNSFSFMASLKLTSQSYLVPNKQNGTFSVALPDVEGKGSLSVSYEIGRVIKYNENDFSAYEPTEDATKKTWVAAQPDNCKNQESGLSAEIQGNNVVITSNTNIDGGAVVVNVKVGESVLPFVVTVPYIGNHVWNFHNMKNKQENRESANWFFDWEVKNGTYIKDPIVLAQEQVQGNNAMLVDQTNGLYINTSGHSQMGLAVIATSNDVESLPQSTENAQTQRSTQIDVVRNVNLLVLKGAQVTVPQVKKDWFVKIYLDPHTGNFHKDGGIGNGCEFSVTNAKDLRGNVIDPTHVIMSYGTQWTRSTTWDDKTSYYGYAGCLIFRAAEDGDVTFDFKENGWDKIVKLEVTDTYSTEMELGTTNLDGRGNNPVDYARWNHSWVHRVGTNGTGNGISYVYDGHPRCHAENAKPIDYTVMYDHGTVNTSVENGSWTAAGGNTYNKGTFTSNNGVGNVKILSQATYNAFSYDGGWHDTGAKYVLNSSEQWVVVGKITEQQYPKTWDFTSYNMKHGTTTENIEGQNYSDQTNPTRTWSVGVNTLACNSDTTYGRWKGNVTNVFITKEQAAEMGIYSSPKTDTYDSPFYTIADDARDGQPATKTYNIPIAKPLFANGAELTTGFETVPETEGLGIILDWSNDPSRKKENVTLDGSKLKVSTSTTNGIYDIVIPNVTEGMYVFVKSSNAPTISPLYDAPETGLYAKNAIVSKATLEAADNTNFGFEKNTTDQNVTVFKVTQTGDVVLRFANNTEIYKIGVTNETKQLTYYGYATESRAINIDYNETKYFSANTEAFYVTDVTDWHNRSEEFDYDKDLEVRPVATTNQIQNEAYIKQGTGIVLHDKEILYEKTQKNTFNDGNGYKIPLFVPACNIEETVGELARKNLLVASTSATQAGAKINSSLEDDKNQIYTMSIRYVPVNKDDNTHLDDPVYTDVPRFYRYVGAGGSAQSTTMVNKAYLALTLPDSESEVKSISNYIRFDFDMDAESDATDINNVDIIDNAAEEGTVYNLRGQAVNSKSAARGIYIKNGKKYYVK